MEKHNFLKKLLALTLATTMTLAIGIPAAATTGVTKYDEDDDGNPVSLKSVEISKTLIIDDNVELPENTTFEVTVNPCGDVGSDNNEIEEGKKCSEYDDNVVYVGVTGGLKGGTISYDEDTDEWEGTLEVDVTVFEDYGPGVYHYVVSETDGGLIGMDYDDTEYDAYVYVYDDGTGNFYVAYVVITKDVTEKDEDGNETTDQKKSDLSFENTYDTASLELEKIITGTQADSRGKWTFKITITGCYEGQRLTSSVKLSGDDVSGGEVDDDGYIITCGGTGEVTITVSLGNGDKIEILGLTDLNSYTIEETEAGTDGYNTTYTVDNDDEKTYSSTTGITGGINDNDGDGAVEDTSVVVKNSKGSDVAPTGVVLNYLPYILLLLVAGAVGFVFFRRRRIDY